ncbi:glycosyltransferase [Denitrificimonas sp. JX-1]|uniref:Glycosyltransferase n=1 Tax=Denitrificimonas halotolerans TaxID=3098930 RepID=A0ABU5GPJ6_9GAMM|nr:glycosyltransferase [Denitrificimonas sp. JX-1]MDY7218789.1 glycosyltransferase [Denitrificimonas sp. JX-1]
MSKILIIDTAWPINTRTERFKNTLSDYFNVTVVAWNRGAKSSQAVPASHYVLENELGYGNKIKKIFSLPKFIRYISKIKKIENPDIIFASHWDSLLCAVSIKVFSRNKIKIIYDCLDLPTSNNKAISLFLKLLERACLRHVSFTIFASRFFKELYPSSLNSYTFENYPSKKALDFDSIQPKWFLDFKENKPESGKNVSWVGVVRYYEILENILKAIVGTSICFYVFGDGPELKKLQKKVKTLNLENQVVFFGRYSPSDLKYIYELADLVWAAYPTNDFNAIYAISNKYFECSYFSKIPIFSKNTMMAKELVKEYSNVVVVDEYNVDDIRNKIKKGLASLSVSYVKYEPDTFWEEKEDLFIDYLKESLNISGKYNAS